MANDPRSASVPRWVGALAVVVSIVSLGLFGLKVLTYYTGPLVLDEWHCGDGEAPAGKKDGSSSCFSKGSHLPVGYTWDELGNRPFECESRYGWEPIVNDATGETDCMRAEEPLTFPPDGYRYVNWEIRS